MKIALITIHYANSYGGTLQALASQKVLSAFGNVEIIDYKSDELRNTLKLIRVDGSVRSVLRAGKDLFRLVPRRRLIKKFKLFIEGNYSLTEECNSFKELQDVSKQFDYVVCGSDQIWNPKITGKLDLNYMLEFATEAKKISFSSSSGSYTYTEAEALDVKRNLATFHSISVREEDTAVKLKYLLDGKEIHHTLDPTLMLNKQEWLQVIGGKKSQNKKIDKYILVYTLKKDPLTREAVNRVRSILGLKVIAIDQDPYLGYRADHHIMDASPSDYISLFSNASFVVTNSFHGTAFSANFEIPFITTQPESGANRIKGLLDNLSLSKQFIQSLCDIDSVLKEDADFVQSRSKLETMRMSSWNYLHNAFSDNLKSENSGVL
ncbi:polysaccharide pyruvyl transferase family protein [Pseudomonas izuensis]|uniref:polysaccharide pyruvyl transferase family protein n=1 Tax=Pseudomonas izuensis TaxID=2684212 RepID=UPI00135C60B3|nr:polysaccharide pyruvyl transferase family protein [Pseudomonas izuensis]